MNEKPITLREILGEEGPAHEGALSHVAEPLIGKRSPFGAELDDEFVCEQSYVDEHGNTYKYYRILR